jgi:predicted DNA-binding transcriptional regulator AlpA
MSQPVYLRLAQIVGNPRSIPPTAGILPIGRATWWRWVKSGKAPKPVRLSAGVTVWRADDVQQFVANKAGEVTA